VTVFNVHIGLYNINMGIKGCDVLFYFIVNVLLSSNGQICVLTKVYHREIGRFSLPRNFRVISRFHQKPPRNSLFFSAN
jgi:hypothetical protein